MASFIQVTPFMHVDDVDRAVDLFVGVLGFELELRHADYAYLHRETVGIRELQNRGADGAPPAAAPRASRRCRPIRGAAPARSGPEQEPERRARDHHAAGVVAGEEAG